MSNNILDTSLLSFNQSSLPETNKHILQQFSSWFNSIYRQSILQTPQENREEQIYLLLTLKKSLKYAITELSRVRKPYNFSCQLCNEVITVGPRDDFWTVFQSHEHFENIYSGQVQLTNLNGDKAQMSPTKDKTSNDVQSDVVCVTDNRKVEESIKETMLLVTEQLSNISISNVSQSSESQPVQNRFSESDTDSDSTFLFNFELKYNEIVESVLYPASVMRDVRKIDKLKDFTIQKSNKCRAVCLLCPCDLVCAKSISKKNIIDHVFGQKHLRCAAIPSNVAALSLYHESFMNMEQSYQSHQVYFKPDLNCAWCVLCKNQVKYPMMGQHIISKLHKDHVMKNFERGADYNLMTLQLEVYGLSSEAVAKKEKTIINAQKAQKKAEKKPNMRDQSNSSSTDTENGTHNIIKAVENPHSQNVLDLIPNRYSKHRQYLQLKGSKVFCTVCNVYFNPILDHIKHHILIKSHVVNSQIEALEYKYYCEICNVKFTDEDLWVKHHNEGPNRHANIAEQRKALVHEYECTTCLTVIYGDELSLSRHLATGTRRHGKREIMLPDKVCKMFENPAIINKKADEMTREAIATVKDEANVTSSCCKDIERLLSTVFNKCKAYPFGSRISGLGNKGSDLDVFLETGGMYNGDKFQDPQDQVQFVKKAEKVFRKNYNILKVITCIPTARTPIIKLLHIATQLDCDISFRHGLSVENTKFLKYCMELQPITQPLILTIKQWSLYCQLNENITTYALAMLAIFFMQTKKYLPSVKKLRELNPGEVRVIDGWDTINYSASIEDVKKTIESCTQDLPTLIKDFFDYYYNFDYTTLVICPLMGRSISKKFFQEKGGEFLPPEMNSYKEKQKDVNGEQFRVLSPFCIQDPFDLSHNLTKACQMGTLNKFKTLCNLSVKHLNKF